jgi:hypothetical protein
MELFQYLNAMFLPEKHPVGLLPLCCYRLSPDPHFHPGCKYPKAVLTKASIPMFHHRELERENLMPELCTQSICGSNS